MENVKEIELSKISLGHNYRKNIDELKINELSESIDKSGLIHPITVRPTVKGYELVVGNRRLLAVNKLAWKTIPAVVKEFTDDQVMEIQITENLQREDIDPLDEAEALANLIEKRKISILDISAKIGKSSTYIHQRLRLCALTEPVKKAVKDGIVPLSAALKLTYFPGGEQKKILESITTKIETDGGSRIVYEGAASLQQSLDDHVEYDLALADFPMDDEELNKKSAVSCTKCPKRTGNTGELFSDILPGNRCMDTPCYFQKSMEYYQNQAEALANKLEVDKKTIGFMPRQSYTSEARFYQKNLKNIIEEHSHHVLNSKEERMEKFNDALIPVVFISQQPAHDKTKRLTGFVVKRDFYYAATREDVTTSKVLTANMKAQKDEKKTESRVRTLIKEHVEENIFAGSWGVNQIAVGMFMEFIRGQNDIAIRVLMRNQVEGWKMETHGQKSKTITVKKDTPRNELRGFILDTILAKILHDKPSQFVLKLYAQAFALANCKPIPYLDYDTSQDVLNAIGLVDYKAVERAAKAQAKQEMKAKPKARGKKEKKTKKKK